MRPVGNSRLLSERPAVTSLQHHEPPPSPHHRLRASRALHVAAALRRRPGLHQALEIHTTGIGSDLTFGNQPGRVWQPVADGRPWGKGADHRADAHQALHPEGVPEPLPASLRSSLEMDWLCLHTRGSGIPPGCKHLWLAYPVVVSPAAPKRPPATGCQPCRVGLATRKDWEDLTPARASNAQCTLLKGVLMKAHRQHARNPSRAQSQIYRKIPLAPGTGSEQYSRQWRQ